MSYPIITIEGIKAEVGRRHFFAFVKEFWEEADTSTPIWNWHIEALCDILQEAGLKLIRREAKEEDIIINLPPGTSKSMVVTVLWPVWLWVNDPTLRVITASYSSGTALELSIKSRNLILSNKFKLYYPEVKLKEDESAKGHYKTTKLGGRLTTSTGSNVIGMHGDVIIGDDLQNLDSVYSDTERERVNRWVTGTLSTRKTDKLNTLMVFVQQRLHQQDLTAYLLSLGNKYKHISLPATLHHTIKPKEFGKYYVGGYLDINRLGEAHLEELRGMLGSTNYNAQILQDPEDASNAIIKREWLSIIDYTQELRNLLYKEKKYYFLDTAYGGKNADYNVILECVVYNNQLYITNVIRNKSEFPELLKIIQENINPIDTLKVYIEGKASGKSIVQTLKSSTKLNIVELQPNGSKLERLNAIAPTVEGGRVYIVRSSWTETLLDEVCSNYPKNDDIRDTFTYAVNELLIKGENYGKYSWA